MQEYDEFSALLMKEDKDGAVRYAIGLLQTEKMDVAALYEKVLAPSLKFMACSLAERRWCIWKEHMRTSIVRTIVECCHPYVMRERREKYETEGRGRVVLVCPTEEYHEIGVRMVADMFTMAGYDVALIGANTPDEDILSAVEYFKPRLLGISVSSSLAIITAERVIEKLRRNAPHQGHQNSGGRRRLRKQSGGLEEDRGGPLPAHDGRYPGLGGEVIPWSLSE